MSLLNIASSFLSCLINQLFNLIDFKNIAELKINK